MDRSRQLREAEMREVARLKTQIAYESVVQLSDVIVKGDDSKPPPPAKNTSIHQHWREPRPVKDYFTLPLEPVQYVDKYGDVIPNPRYEFRKTIVEDDKPKPKPKPKKTFKQGPDKRKVEWEVVRLICSEILRQSLSPTSWSQFENTIPGSSEASPHD
jgi:hypothetical protein